ncbi:SafA/ExsA family spore coat assembly protein [Bacillota bacterium Lsc_1132]
MKIHIVQKGDTLWKIAKKYGVNFEELKKMNSQLSNPDMIMPGMKVKVPTSGGMIKKEAPMGTKPGAENIGVKKEIPLEHPFAKEKPIPAPIVEAPVEEAPIIKEAPKAPYTPKMPLPVIPEIDINNYYMMNMANMTVQQPPQPQLPPKPVTILPEVKAVPKKEIPVPVEESPLEMPPQGVEQPMCQDYCVPVTPVMPGPGFCPPEYPLQPMMPFQQPPYNPAVTHGVMSAASVPTPAVAGASFAPPQYEDESSSSFMPQMPMMNPMAGTMPGVGVQGQMMDPQGMPMQGMESQYPMMNPQGMPMQGMESQYPMMNPQGMPMQGMESQYPMMNPQGMPMQGMESQYSMMNPQGMPMQGMEPQYPMMNPQGMPMQGMESQYPMMNPQGMPMQGMEPQYPMMNPQGMPMQGMEPQYPMMNPQGIPMQGYPGYPAGYYSGRQPVAGSAPVMMNPYGNPGMVSPYSNQAMMYPYGQMTYGYPQMGAMQPGIGMDESGFESPEMAAQAYPVQGQIPVSTGGLGDCGCMPSIPPQTFVPPTPPIYSAPYTAPATFAQPPFMNPYGMGPIGAGSYAMPRYEADGNEENDD